MGGKVACNSESLWVSTGENVIDGASGLVLSVVSGDVYVMVSREI